MSNRDPADQFCQHCGRLIATMAEDGVQLSWRRIGRILNLTITLSGWLFFLSMISLYSSSTVIYGTNVPHLARKLEQVWQADQRSTLSASEGFRVQFQRP